MFLYFCKQAFHIPSAYHFYVNPKILVDFHFCISVPFKLWPAANCISVAAWNRAVCLLHRVFRPLKNRFILCHFGACDFVLTHKSNRKFKTQTGQKTERERERERVDKEVWMKGKEKVFNKRIWLIHNMKVILYCCWRDCLIRNQKILPSTCS